MKLFTLIKTNYSHHVSMDLYHEFESEIIVKKNWEIVNGIGSLRAKIIRQLLKIIPPFKIPVKKDKNYVVIGYQKEKFFPYFHYKTTSKTLWMYDAWEPLFNDIEKTIRQYKINYLFTASRQSSDYFNSLGIENFKSGWIPEAVEVSNYDLIDYQDRQIDVLQLGRRWNDYHDKISKIEGDFIYKYEKKRGEIIFKTRAEFITGLANSKISICVPSAITHPHITGSVSTITNRYLQSMASKCLILGKLPSDMVSLFGYNPIIEIDENDPVGQIKSILQNFDTYIPLIEKNYTVVKENHTWNKRIEQMESLMR